MRLFSPAACRRASVAVLVVIFLAFGCGQLAGLNQAIAAGPVIWAINNEGGKGRVYLLGSLHMMKKNVPWYTSKIQHHLAQATDVVFEIKLDTAGMAEMTKFVSREGYYDDGEGLKDHIGDSLFDKTAVMAKEVGLESDFLERLKPWYAATVLSLYYIQAHGYDPDAGVEPFIEEIVKQRGLPLGALDSVDDQMQLLTGIAPETQQLMLRDTVTRLKDIDNRLDRLTRAWLSGNVKQLDALLIGGEEGQSVTYERLIAQRNRQWIPKIKALMDKPGTHFVVVGMMHLLGPKGVVQLLRNQGINVKES